MADNTKNFYKKFRTVESSKTGAPIIENSFTKTFDEPTYFSFRLKFGDQSDINYNVANQQALYDTMPHPLFNAYGESNIYDFSSSLPTFGTIDTKRLKTVETYSAKQYLIDANEPTRALMMEDFINKFNVLQNEYPYYFQSIEGLADLMKVDPIKGQREPNDRKITIKCLEGIDLRMSYLLNLYRKIVWDDVYQRWILPDMMRYFTLKIYLSEFRTFHTPSKKRRNADETEVGKNPLYLDLLDMVLPTWVITCEMCEFDLTDMDFEQLHGLDIGADHSPIAIKFGIKVGFVTEMQIYPQFKHMFLIDRKLNGRNRVFDEDSTSKDNNIIINEKTLHAIAQHRENYDSDTYHISGLPYNEAANSKKLYGENGPGLDQNWGTKDDDIETVDPTNPRTWVGSAVKFGVGMAKNFVNKYTDLGKITSIPGLGVSFSEVTAAIQGKNVVGAFGLIRKGINETVKSFENAPSSKLNTPLQTDNIMKAFLTELSTSKATDEETKFLSDAAILTLNNNEIWEQIRNYVSTKDTVKTLEDANQYSEIVKQQSRKTEKSLDEFTINLPTILSNAVSNRSIEEEFVIENDANKASSKLKKDINEKIIQPESRESLTPNIIDLNISMGKSSERLETFIETDMQKEEMVSERLSLYTPSEDNIESSKPSELLKQSIQDTAIRTQVTSKSLEGEITENLKKVPPSENLSLKIEESAIKDNNKILEKNEISDDSYIDNNPKIKSKTIDTSKIIEYKPTNIMYKKIEEEEIKQPPPSKATNSKLE